MPQLRTCTPPASRLAVAIVSAVALTAGVAPGQPPRKVDPVEEFRQALMLERNIRNDDKAALDFRTQNLAAKAKQVRLLSDLSRVLLLSEWQTEVAPGSRVGGGFDWEVRAAEARVRRGLTKRFEDGVKELLQRRNPDQLAAVANLLSETVVGASTLGAANSLGRERLFLYTELANLAPDLVPLTRNPSVEVRVAAARALGNFPTKPEVVVDALRAMLAPQWDARTRLAAAEALVTLVRVVSGRQAIQRSSEPGVGLRPDQARSFAFKRNDEINVYDLVVPAAARGLSDPDLAVRRASVNAVRQVTLSMTEMVPNVDLPPEYINLPGLPYPAPGRTTWTPREREHVNEGRAFVRELKRDLGRVLPGFEKNVGALTGASADPDPTVRIQARKALEDLALVRRLLNNLDAFMPKDPAGTLPPPGPEKGRKIAGAGQKVTLGAPAPTRRVMPPRATLGSPSLPARAAAAAPAARLVLVRLEQAAPDKKAPETPGQRLTPLVDKARQALIQEGLRDPDPQGRLAAIEALELLGTQAEPAIPALAQALGDRNKFVRWAAARTLGHMGLAEQEALPGLLRLLCDQDLDVRVAALDALRRYGPKVAAAVPALTALLGRGDTESRIATLHALAAIGQAAESSLPSVARALKNPDPRMRVEAARTLGEFGRAAGPYVAALRGAMEDLDPDVRKAASEAILRITLGQ